MSWLSWMKHSRWTWALVLATVGSVVLGACSPLPEEENPDPSGATLATVSAMEDITLMTGDAFVTAIGAPPLPSDGSSPASAPLSDDGGFSMPFAVQTITHTHTCPGGGTLDLTGELDVVDNWSAGNTYDVQTTQLTGLTLTLTSCVGYVNTIDGTVSLRLGDSFSRTPGSPEPWVIQRVESASGSLTVVRSNGSTYNPIFSWSRAGSLAFDYYTGPPSSIVWTNVVQSYMLSVDGQTCTRTTTILYPPSTGWNCN